MKLHPCACGAQHFARVQRRLWMRVFDSRRLYFCQKCSTLAFLRREHVDRMLIEAAAARTSPGYRAPSNAVPH